MIAPKIMKNNRWFPVFFPIVLLLLTVNAGCGNNNAGTGIGNNNSSSGDPEIRSLDPEASLVTPDQFVVYDIGRSVSGVPVSVTEAGSGSQIGLVLIGAIHGNESNTSLLVKALASVYTTTPTLVPGHIRLFFVSEPNPDGLKNKTRDNSRRVDLNRNFPVDDWKADAVSPSDIRKGSGGREPGSEPEVKALVDWISNTVKEKTASVYIISFHAAYPPSGSVQPGYLKYGTPGNESARFAQFIAGVSGYQYIRTWVTAKPLTGEFIHWCETNGISSCDIELPDYKSPDIVPAGKKESTVALFKRVLEKVFSEFFTAHQ